METASPVVNSSWALAVDLRVRRNYLISASTVRVVEIVLQAGVLPLLVLCGVALNVINMLVFAYQGLSDRINVCLFCLSLCDLGYLTFMMTSRFHALVSLVSHTIGEYWKERSYLLVGVYAGFLSTSNCLTTLIALDRCLCVIFPLTARSLLSDRTIKVLIVAVFLVCFSSSFIFFFIYDVHSYQDPVTNITRFRVVTTQFYDRNRQIIDIFYENFSIFVPVISLAIVIAATFLIALRMRTVLAWREETTNVGISSGMSTSRGRREASVTRMLVVVCCMYTFCSLPMVTHALCRFLLPEFGPAGAYRNTFFLTVAIFHTVLSVNSSCNFWVYLTMSSRFKQSLKDVLRIKVKVKVTTPDGGKVAGDGGTGGGRGDERTLSY